MSKIHLHNLSVNYSNYNPDLFHFDQNGIFFAEPGDAVITRLPISNTYLSFLDSIGIPSRGVTLFHSEDTFSQSPFSIFKDKELIKKLRSYVNKHKKKVELDSFMVTEWEGEWAKDLGLSSTVNADNYYNWGSKSVFRKFSKKNNFSIPKGFEDQKSVVDKGLTSSLLYLLGADEIVIKKNEGVAGLGSKRIKRKQFLSNISKLNYLFSTPTLNQNVIPTRSEDYVVEKWYQNVVSSPSIQFYISEHGEAVFISIHQQIFYENSMTYRGCYSYQWVQPGIQQKLVDVGTEFVELLAKEGARGHITLNTIVLDDGNLLITEINPRRVMSSYPFQIARLILGDSLKEHRYISMIIRRKSLRERSIKHVLDQFSSILFSNKSKKGIIPYNYGLLHSKGQLSIMAIGSDKEEVENQLAYATSI